MAHFQNTCLCCVIKVQGITSSSRRMFQHNSQNNFKSCEPCPFFIGEFSAISSHIIFQVIKNRYILLFLYKFSYSFMFHGGHRFNHISVKYPLTLALILIFDQLTCTIFLDVFYFIHSIFCI